MVKAYRPSTLEEAMKMLEETDGIPFAGGTDLMVRYRRKPGVPPAFDRPVVFIGHLPELRNLSFRDGTLRIGAAVPLAELLRKETLSPGLLEALCLIGSPAIRNSATLAGNICNASPAADSLPALYCLDASVEVLHQGSVTSFPINDFITGPGTTALPAGALVLAVTIPETTPLKIFYRRIGTRRANALSKLSFLALYRLEGKVVRDLRIAFGAASPTVLRLPEAEKRCLGKTPVQVALEANDITALYEPLLIPIDDQRSTAGYRKRTALRLLDSFLTKELTKS